MATMTVLNKSQLRKQVPKDTYALLSTAMDKGLKMIQGTKHIKILDNQDNIITTAAKTPSDSRDLRNLRADIEKAGIILSPTKEAKRNKAATEVLPEVTETVTTEDVVSETPLHKTDDPVAVAEVVSLMIDDFGDGNDFSVAALIEAVAGSGFHFEVSDLENSVRAKVRHMVATGEIRRVSRGVYKKPKARKPRATPEPTVEVTIAAPTPAPVVPVVPRYDPVENVVQAFKDLSVAVKALETNDPHVWDSWAGMCEVFEHMENALRVDES